MKYDFIPPSELIINPNGSVYHLHLKPGEVATTIITVGDPERVDAITKHFESIEFTRQNREFKTSTGNYLGKRLTVISTGIGTDNVDIVMNEIDALFQFDFKSRNRKNEFQPLTFIRLGTSGAIQPDVPMDSLLVSATALSFDALIPFYSGHHFSQPEVWPEALAVVKPYLTHANKNLLSITPPEFIQGLTATMPGFYAPQGRNMRLNSVFGEKLMLLRAVIIQNQNITNIEMETAGIYALADLLGHRAISFNAILANRATGGFSTHPEKTIEKMISIALPWVAGL